MAKTKISEFDVDPANNTDINSINIAEGCAPSGINNAIRQLMSDLKEFQTGAASDSFTVGGAFSANGGATLGDASGDALTINSSAVSIPNGLNFDSNTFVIDATNNRVGLGSTAPSYKLVVVGAQNTTTMALNDSSAGESARNLLFTPSSNGLIWTLNSQGSSSLGQLAFATNSAEAMRINASGNVGIGNSSPTQKLQVSGSAVIENSLLLFNNATDFVLGSNPAIYSTGTGGSGIFAQAGNLVIQPRSSGAGRSIIFANGNPAVEAMRLDTSGNLGLGVTPSAWSGAGNFTVGGGSGIDFANAYGTITANAYYNAGWKYRTTSTATNYYQSNGSHIWYNAPSGTAGNAITFTQAMTLDASGNLLVGKTSASNSATGIQLGTVGDGYMTRANNGEYWRFYNPSGTQIGYIGNSGGTSTVYSTSSDYRLKENIAPMTGALEKVAQLKPCTYTWKADGSDGQGFIAHELAEIVPDCVTGEKDAVNEDGSIKPQGIDTSFLVATLTAAIQELKAEVDSLKAKLNKE